MIPGRAIPVPLPREPIPLQPAKLTRPWPWIVRWRENGIGLAVHEAGMRSKRMANHLAAWLVAQGWTVEVMRGRRCNDVG